MLDTIGVPAFTQAFKQDPELSIGTSISKHMWTSNPGYVLRDGSRMASTEHQAYVWSDEEVKGQHQQHDSTTVCFRWSHSILQLQLSQIGQHHCVVLRILVSCSSFCAHHASMPFIVPKIATGNWLDVKVLEAAE